MYHHPKYYAPLRRKLQASSSKPQAKPEPSSGSETSSNKLQAPGYKPQA